ncbi:MAG: hypothetical protein ACLTV6_00370 [Christensenellales bacterium]
MKSEKKLDDVIRREMTEIRDQYGDDRRTELIEDDSATLPVVEKQTCRRRHGYSAPARWSAAPHEPAHGG